MRKIWAVGFICLLVGGGIGWFLTPGSPWELPFDEGTAGEWFSGFGAFAAVVVALTISDRERRQRAEDEKLRRAVHSKSISLSVARQSGQASPAGFSAKLEITISSSASVRMHAVLINWLTPLGLEAYQAEIGTKRFLLTPPDQDHLLLGDLKPGQDIDVTVWFQSSSLSKLTDGLRWIDHRAVRADWIDPWDEEWTITPRHRAVIDDELDNAWEKAEKEAAVLLTGTA